MDELLFKVSAELKNILGRELITNSNIAILELVKNSYDAYATKVDITFEKDRIVIADNGKGMSKEDIINKWLFVGYSAKRDGTEDLSYRSKFKRYFAGAKGIGRMSCDRLARFLTMTTKNANSSFVESITVDWMSFESKQNTEFDTISVKHNSSSCLQYFPSNALTGTILEFSGLHDIWQKDEILSLRKSLEKMINPFSGTDNFNIEIIAPAFIDFDNQLRQRISESKNIYNSLSERERQDVALLENSIINGVIQNSIADILKIKTTQIESQLKDGVIKTKLTDRGDAMYEIEEINKFSKLEDVSISIYYLNRSAKYNFSLKMGVSPVNYGNVFLFRNGFRIWPYGEFYDDSWRLNQRAQQGYNRFLGTRDLFGRVDIETTHVNDFKEVSSRDGGLINNEATQQLHAYFDLIHRRLERYVTGVLWGEGFLRNEYFKNTNIALEARKQIQGEDKDSDNVANVYKNIGSKVDFLQVVKSLVNDGSILVKYYNSKLADIVSDASTIEVIQAGVIDDLRKVAEKTDDENLAFNITLFEQQLAEMRREKANAERIAEEERKRAEEAQEAAIEAERKRKIEEEKRKEKEKELEAQKQMNLYLSSTQNTSSEVKDLMHAVALSSNDLDALIDTMSSGLRDHSISTVDVLNHLDEMAFHTSRIIKISKMLTKADINLLSESTEVDIKEYIKEYILNFENSIHIIYGEEYKGMEKKLIPILELSIVLDNLVSNAKKADATEITIDFANVDNTIEVLFTDNGLGVNLERYTAESIFDPGVTDRRGGSGIGLSTIKNRMAKDLNGKIEFMGNGLRYPTGASFKLTFY